VWFGCWMSQRCAFSAADGPLTFSLHGHQIFTHFVEDASNPTQSDLNLLYRVSDRSYSPIIVNMSFYIFVGLHCSLLIKCADLPLALGAVGHFSLKSLPLAILGEAPPLLRR
jgi:hypothetical protein